VEYLHHLVGDVWIERRHGEAAIAVDRRGDAVTGQRVHRRRPPDRRIPMIVVLDETGRDITASGVDHALARRGLQARGDLDDAAAGDADVPVGGGRAAPVDDRAALDRYPEFHGPLLAFVLTDVASCYISGKPSDASWTMPPSRRRRTRAGSFR